MKKENRERLEYKVFTRLGREKYDELAALLEKSRHRNMSSMLRDVLHSKKIVIENYDGTLDKVMEELGRIRSELHAIGVNINQVTRRFNQEHLAGEQLNQALEITKFYQQADQKVSELFEIISKLSLKWLPE